MTAPAYPDLLFAAVPHLERTRLLTVTSFIDADNGTVSIAFVDRSADPHDPDENLVSLPVAAALKVADAIRLAYDETAAILDELDRRSVA